MKPERFDLINSPHSSIMWNLNKSINDPNIRNIIADRIAQFLPIRSPFSEFKGSTAHQTLIKLLKDEGWVGLKQKLNDPDIAKIITYFEQCDDTVVEKSLTHYKIADIVNAPYLLQLAVNSEILHTVASYLKVAPTVVDICAWWSHATDKEPFGAQILHRDRDDFRFCKLFLYLTDVNTDNGPHTFLPRSHTVEGMTKLFENRNNQPDQIQRAFTNDSRQSSDWIRTQCESDILEIIGDRGSAFLVNTFGYHCGKPPRKGSRLVFQVVYAQQAYNRRIERLSQTHHLPLPDFVTNNAMARYACRLIGKA